MGMVFGQFYVVVCIRNEVEVVFRLHLIFVVLVLRVFVVAR